MMIMADKKKKKPTFNVLNLGFKKRVKSRWRKPRGTHNKKRMGKEFTGASPSIGYGTPASIRGKRNGMEEVLVCNVSELEGLKDVLLRISAKVGKRKRLEIAKKAKALSLKIVNFRENGSKKPAEKPEKKPAPKKGLEKPEKPKAQKKN